MKNKASYRERLIEIINLSYKLLCCKVGEKSIILYNEASFQLQLGVIMKQVGQLYEFDLKDRFVIHLESPKEIDPTIKSPNGKARCDIEISIFYGDTCKAKALIELKYFRKNKNEAITDNRFALFKDLKNLEIYKTIEQSRVICCAIVCTDNENYTKSDTSSKINIGNDVISTKEICYTTDKTITLENVHHFNWDSTDNGYHFLKIIF